MAGSAPAAPRPVARAPDCSRPSGPQPARRVDALILQGVVADIVRLAVLQPAMTQGVTLGMQAEHPRRIVLQDAVHLANDPRRSGVLSMFFIRANRRSNAGLA